MINRAAFTAAFTLVSSIGAGALAGAAPDGSIPPPSQELEQDNRSDLKTITVEAARERTLIEHQVKSYVSAISVAPYQESLARWETPLCPLVAGLPREHGEFILERITQVAAAAGAPLAAEHCRGNFYVIVTADPDTLLKAWRKHDPNMFGDAAASKIHGFLSDAGPIRVWYNAVMIDSRRARGVSFGQLADYVAMAGLAEVRLNADVADAPTIFNLFSVSGKKLSPALSAWDEAFLKELYHSDPSDKTQLSAIKGSVARDVVR